MFLVLLSQICFFFFVSQIKKKIPIFKKYSFCNSKKFILNFIDANHINEIDVKLETVLLTSINLSKNQVVGAKIIFFII